MRRSHLLVLGILIAFLGAFLFYPLGYVFRGAFFPEGRFSLAFFASLFANPVMRASLTNSLLLALATTLVTILLAIPLAFLSVRYTFPGKALFTGLLLVPLIMPPFVGAIGMRQLLARFGSVNLLLLESGILANPVDWLGAARFWGIVIVMALHLYPILYLNLSAALANVDPSLNEAAVNLGSNPWRTFRRVTLPLMMPGLFSGSVIVFVSAFTDLGTPLVFQYRAAVPVQIFDRITDIGENPEGYALVVVVIVLSAAIFLAAKRLFGTSSFEVLGKGGSRATEKRLGPLGSVLAIGLLLLVVAVACVPHLGVILTSVSDKWFMTALPETYTSAHYRDALSHPLTLPSIRNSIILSSCSTVLDLVIGLTVAYLLTRKRFRGADFLDALVMLPLAIPGLVLAFGYVGGYSGTILDPRRNPMYLLILAYSIRRLPYVVRAAYAGFQQVSRSLEEAGINLGSSPARALRRVTLPLIGANVLAGGVLAFSLAMLEVGDSLLLALKEQFFPITKAIYQMLGRIEDGAYIASALGVWAMVFLALSLMTVGALMGRRMGQMFRA